MKKFVYFSYGDAYEAYINNAIMDEPNAFAFIPFRWGLFKKLQILHNSRPLNTICELPFKNIWFKRALKGMTLNETDEIYFLLYESFHLSYSKQFLQYLKYKFPLSKLCFMYLNPVTDLIKEKIEKTGNNYDAIITFNEKDAKKYNLLFCRNQPYRLPIIKDDKLPKTDVFFIGSDKGRLPKLLAIYEKLVGAGLKCDFHIVGVPEENQLYKDGIIYNKPIPYEEVLAHVWATKCVLEILQGNEDYTSIRTFEAIQYRRKLLTESKSIIYTDYYDPSIIQVFSDPEDIDLCFLKEPLTKEMFSGIESGSSDRFHEFLINNVS